MHVTAWVRAALVFSSRRPPDPRQIEQVVVNARDAMPRGGNVTIETRNIDFDESYVLAHSDVRPGEHARQRHGDGHGRADALQNLRTLLHDQGSGQGHQARTLDGVTYVSSSAVHISAAVDFAVAE